MGLPQASIDLHLPLRLPPVTCRRVGVVLLLADPGDYVAPPLGHQPSHPLCMWRWGELYPSARCGICARGRGQRSDLTFRHRSHCFSPGAMDEAPALYGVGKLARSICAVEGDARHHRFLVGTLCLQENNEVGPAPSRGPFAAALPFTTLGCPDLSDRVRRRGQQGGVPAAIRGGRRGVAGRGLPDQRAALCDGIGKGWGACYGIRSYGPRHPV